MFHLLTGSYRALEKSFLDDIRLQRQNDPFGSLLVLSPSQRLLDHLQSELGGQGLGFLNIHFLTFYALAEQLLKGSPVRSDRVTTEPMLYAQLIHDLLEGTSDVELITRKHLYSRKTLLSQGLCLALAATLRDLRDSGARVVDCLKAALEGSLGKEAPEAAPTLELYARVYEVLQKRGLRTLADQLRRAAEQAPQHPWLRQQKAIYLYGFYDLTGVQLDFVLSLGEHPDAQMYFPYVDDPNYAYAGKLLNDPLFRQKIQPKPSALNEVAPKEKNVEHWNCSGPRDEVWLTAKKILLLRESGIPFGRMAVVARQLDSYLSAIQEIYPAQSIPYFCSQGESVGAFPLIKTARGLLQLAESNSPASLLIEVLKSPYFKLPAIQEGLGPEKLLRIWEIFTRDAGITVGLKTARTRLKEWMAHGIPRRVQDHLGESVSASLLQRLLESFDQLVEALSQDLTAPCGLNSWSHHVAWAEKILNTWLTFQDSMTFEEHQLEEALHHSLHALTALDALGHLTSRKHFYEIWKDKIDHLTVRLQPFRTPGVHVAEVQQIRGMHFKAVFLLGLNEKSFPRLIREDPFLSDAARSALSQTLGCRLPRKMDGYQEERLLFKLTQEAAEDHLFFLRQRSDDEGKVLVPSIYLRERSKDPPSGVQHLPRAWPEKCRQISPTLWTPKELSLFLNRQARDPSRYYLSLGWDNRLFHTFSKAHQTMEAFGQGITAYDGRVGPSTALEHRTRGFSPHALQALAECPFQYFASTVLGLTPLAETLSEGELNAKDLGRLFHRVLEIFYQKGILSPSPLSVKIGDAEITQKIEEACQACWREFQDVAGSLYPVAWKATRNLVRKRLEKFLKQDLQQQWETGFRPVYLEKSMCEEIPHLDATGPSPLFTGRPDRIDVRKGRNSVAFRVIDYKSGRPSRGKGKTETAVLRGAFLQLPIYLGLAEEFLKKQFREPLHAEGAFLYYLLGDEADGEGCSIGSDFWDAYGKRLGETIGGLMALVKRGHFYIQPSDAQGHCVRCSFASLCRKTHLPTRFRSDHDPIRVANENRLLRKAEETSMPISP